MEKLIESMVEGIVDEDRPKPLLIRGADISSLQRSMDLGARYFDENGKEGDALQILQDHGVNFIRLRVWVNPAYDINNKAATINFARLVKARGLKLLIDLHYSDTWADPEHQLKPAAWAGHSIVEFEKDVYDHTWDVINSMKVEDVTPDMVQIGNEINPGMLLPEGSVKEWDNLSAFLKKGFSAVKDCSSTIQVMLHIANAGDQAGARAWFDQAIAHEVQWDVTGLSYYSYWHGSLQDMTGTVNEVRARYGRPVIIVETAYPFTLEENDGEKNSVNSASQLTNGYPATPAGQAGNLRAVIQAASMGGAVGFFYWEPTWTVVKGNGWNPVNPDSGNQWENQALFDFSGKVLPALSEFKA